MRVVYKKKISERIFAAREEAMESLREIDRIILTKSEAASLRREIMARSWVFHVPPVETGFEHLGIYIEVEDD